MPWPSPTRPMRVTSPRKPGARAIAAEEVEEEEAMAAMVGAPASAELRRKAKFRRKSANAAKVTQKPADPGARRSRVHHAAPVPAHHRTAGTRQAATAERRHRGDTPSPPVATTHPVD